MKDSFSSQIIRKSGFAALLLMLSGCYAEVYTELTERQANEIVSVLIEQGVDARKESLGKSLFSVNVSDDKLGEAFRILASNGLPTDEYANIHDLYKKEGLISSPMEERMRYMYTLSQTVAETLSNIDGVIVARVHVAVPEGDKFSGEIAPTSASVFIKYQEGFDLSEAGSEIKMIVESSIEGLSYEKIAVFMSPSGYSRQKRRMDDTIVNIQHAERVNHSNMLMGANMIFVLLVFGFYVRSMLGGTKKQDEVSAQEQGMVKQEKSPGFRGLKGFRLVFERVRARIRYLGSEYFGSIIRKSQ